MNGKTIWEQAIEHMIMSGESQELSTGAIAILNFLARSASPLTGVSRISLAMLADMCVLRREQARECVKELIEKQILVNHTYTQSTVYALHHRLQTISGEVTVA